MIQSNSIIDSMLVEIRLMLSNSDYKIICVSSEEKSLELESLLKYYYKIASSIVEPDNIKICLNDEKPCILEDKILQNLDYLQTPQSSPIQKSNESNGAQIRQKLLPPKRLLKKPKEFKESCINSLKPITTNKISDENNNLKYELFTENEFNEQDRIQFRLCKFISPEEIWLVPGLRVKILDKMVSKHKKFESQLILSEEEAQNLSIGELVGYKSEKHDHIYRAEIMEKILDEDGSTWFDVHGIDNCKKLRIKFDRLRKLIKDYKDIPKLKIKCSLNNLKPCISENDTSENKWPSKINSVAKKWLIDHQANISLKVSFFII